MKPRVVLPCPRFEEVRVVVHRGRLSLQCFSLALADLDDALDSLEGHQPYVAVVVDQAVQPDLHSVLCRSVARDDDAEQHSNCHLEVAPVKVSVKDELTYVFFKPDEIRVQVVGGAIGVVTVASLASVAEFGSAS